MPVVMLPLDSRPQHFLRVFTLSAMHRTSGVALLLALASARAGAQNSSIHEPGDSTLTIPAAAMIDGRGHLQRDVLVSVRKGKIERVESSVGARGAKANYDLGAATLLPGLIDAHVHPGWYITK